MQKCIGFSSLSSIYNQDRSYHIFFYKSDALVGGTFSYYITLFVEAALLDWIYISEDLPVLLCLLLQHTTTTTTNTIKAITPITIPAITPPPIDYSVPGGQSADPLEEHFTTTVSFTKEKLDPWTTKLFKV